MHPNLRKVSYTVIFLQKTLTRQVAYESGEALIQPNISPPLHCNKISKPLVRNLMQENAKIFCQTHLLNFIKLNRHHKLFRVNYASGRLHSCISNVWTNNLI